MTQTNKFKDILQGNLLAQGNTPLQGALNQSVISYDLAGIKYGSTQLMFVPEIINAETCQTVSEGEEFDSSNEKSEVYDLYKKYMDNMAALNPNPTMTSLPLTYELPSSQVKSYYETRELLFKTPPALFPSNQTVEIAYGIVRYGMFIKKAGLFPLIYYKVMRKIAFDSESFVIDTDSNLLMDGLMAGAKLCNHDIPQIAQVYTLREKLLLFFDKLYPVNDFIEWVENNLLEKTFHQKTIFAYYVLKSLSLDEINYEDGIKKIDNVLTHADSDCKGSMDDFFRDIFFDCRIIDKFYVLATRNHLHHILFPSYKVRKYAVLTTNLERTKRYDFSTAYGLHSTFAADGYKKKEATVNDEENKVDNHYQKKYYGNEDNKYLNGEVSSSDNEEIVMTQVPVQRKNYNKKNYRGNKRRRNNNQ